MLAIALAPCTATPTPAPTAGRDRSLPRSLTVQGRICSVPTLSFTATGLAVAHFLLDCDDLPDPRLRILAHRGTTVIDVTVWREDAVFVADTASAYHFRYRCVREARAALPVDRKQEAVVWDIQAPFTPLIRRGVRVAIDGTPRRGSCHPIGCREPLPLGLVADGLPRPLGRACRA